MCWCCWFSSSSFCPPTFPPQRDFFFSADAGLFKLPGPRFKEEKRDRPSALFFFTHSSFSSTISSSSSRRLFTTTRRTRTFWFRLAKRGALASRRQQLNSERSFTSASNQLDPRSRADTWTENRVKPSLKNKIKNKNNYPHSLKIMVNQLSSADNLFFFLFFIFYSDIFFQITWFMYFYGVFLRRFVSECLCVAVVFVEALPFFATAF